LIQRTRARIKVAAISLLLISTGMFAAQKKANKAESAKTLANSPEVIWHDPGDISSLDMIHGIGGVADAPDPNAVYTFVEEDMKGTSPKVKVKDAQGVEWKLKMGAEPQAETAATRLLYAAGYFVDEDYYSAEIKVANLPKLKRGENFVHDGVLHGVRLERKIKGQKDLGNWDWFKNPFIGTREFNGLRVMMSLLNNWDLKEVNNDIYEIDGERRYVVADVGATFGKTGDPLTRSKSDVKGYEKSKFIDKEEKGGFVDFVLHSRPPLIAALNAENYKERSRMENITKHVPHDDARWLGELLSHLTDEQIRDCFRSAGYNTDEVEEYTHVIKDRIAALNAL
jgi:hypothetical protein